MYYRVSKHISAIVFVLMLAACVENPTTPSKDYSPTANARLYDLNNWRLEGRLAVTGTKDSWSANVQWQHLPEQEKIKLFGPLGQGVVTIALDNDYVVIDRGGGRVQSSGDPEQFISQQLGLAVPLHSLRYWAIGLPEPAADYQATADGFVQFGWLIAYKDIRANDKEYIPHKMSVSKHDIKLKLIVDQWDLNAGQNN